MLDRIQLAHEDHQSLPPEVPADPLSSKSSRGEQTKPEVSEESRIYFRRQLLTRSVEGRRVDIITITDCHGMSGLQETLPEGVMGEEQEDPQADEEAGAGREQPGVVRGEEEEVVVQNRDLGPAALFRGKKVCSLGHA
jgi:hypothetical protein